jgi:peptidoglycan/xylan/chitin deacetylase (PgdA/CDA1 family)
LREENNPIQSGATVLEFHKIGSPPRGCNSAWYTPEDTFVGHLRYLHDGGWRVVSLAELLDNLEIASGPSERLALLTFDDAYRSLRTTALPRLREFGYPAAVFVPTKFIGGHNDFDHNIEPKEEICGWEDLHELASCGVSVQSHGVSHRMFSTLNDSELSDEIGKSKEVLESRLGIHVEAFGYPYGNPGGNYQRTSELLRKAGYRAAFVAEGGSLSIPVDRYRLNRQPILPHMDPHWVLAQ